jgi:L-histidine N-alpha-methyltransferase
MSLPSHADIIEGLSQWPARISPKYFYDQRGSELFEEITRLPEYYPTRTERAVMQEYAQDIARAIGAGVTLIELGAGSCEKARVLCKMIEPIGYIGVDISADYLHASAQALQSEFPDMDVRALGADLTGDLALPVDVPRARRLVFYPGSSIGNFDPPHALALLTRMRAMVDGDGGLLIGVDLPKDPDVLELAYDDAAGVTAQFNRNVLRHVNRLIGADFDEQQWQHCAFYNPDASRIEMHLQAVSEVTVRWPGGGRHFARFECIHTENSYKYPLSGFTDMLKAAGFSHAQAWTDPHGWFAVVLARP